MKVLIQRVKHANVTVDDHTIGAIDRGLLLFVGIEKHDNSQILERMADKVLSYRIFPDSAGKMNLSVRDVHGGVLAISQFTLAADTRKGLRPSFSSAAPPDMAKDLFHQYVEMLQQKHDTVEQGEFAADMQVSLLNDGPVTFLLDIDGQSK